MALGAGADGALLLLRGSGDLLLLGRWDEAVVAEVAEVARAAAAVDERSDRAFLREIGGGVLERARLRRCGGTDLE